MADNRTEQATPRRRQQARDKGQVLRSRDLITTLALLAVTFVLAWHPEVWVGRWAAFFSRSMEASVKGEWSDHLPVIGWTGLVVAQWVAPVFAVAFFISLAATFAQGGLAFSTEAFTPDFNRLNPAKNVQRMFSLAAFSNVLRSLFPSGVIFYLALRMIVRDAPSILHSARLPSRAALSLLGQMSFELAWKSGLVLLVWSGADYFLQRYTFEKSLRMTKQEVKEESKDIDGNPHVRMRMRKLRRELLRRIMQQDIKRATAVITNPTHYAVAIEYRPAKMFAPVVVAKGRNLLAQRIKQLARWHEIPIVENPPLAQALYKATQIGQIIPPKLYAAVAEILAFIYRAQKKLDPYFQSEGTGAR